MQRYPNRLTVFFVDLDGFKAVNDTHGHEVGDEVLVEVARRLLRITRNHDTVARLGGDEFVVLCDPLVDAARVWEIGRRVVAALAEPFETSAGALLLSASVGADSADDARLDAATVLRNADAAMYAAKQRGRNGFVVFAHGLVEPVAAGGPTA